MKTKIFTVIALLSFFSLASADIRPLENSDEVVSSQVQIPNSVAGSVIYKKCRSCDSITLRVSSSTEFKIDGRTTSLAQFRAEFAARRSGGEFLIVVFSDIETNFVTGMSMEKMTTVLPTSNES